MQILNIVLLVDDDPAVNFYHNHILQEANIAEQVAQAYNGKDALSYLCCIEKFKRREAECQLPSLIFLDLNMPVMNGFDFLDVFEKWSCPRKNDIKVCILTTSDHELDHQKAATYSCIAEYLSKPLSSEVLQQVVQKYFT